MGLLEDHKGHCRTLSFNCVKSARTGFGGASPVLLGWDPLVTSVEIVLVNYAVTSVALDNLRHG